MGSPLGSRIGKSDPVEQPGIPRSKVRPFWKRLDEGKLPAKDQFDWFALSWLNPHNTLFRKFLEKKEIISSP